MPGGFHPFHAGHMALYNAARAAFPSAEVYVAATADTSERPFPFPVKKALAKAAGVPQNRFIQVKSPFRPEEITQFFDPNDTQLIYVRSEKDRNEKPQPGGVKKDGSPAYLQPYRRNGLEPMSKHGYMAYLPTVQFGPGMTSATEIRSKWPGMTAENKINLVKTLYPGVAENDAAAGKLVQILDSVMAPAAKKKVDETLKGAPAGGGAMNPTATPMPNAAVDEAVLVNDPEAGTQIRPAGGMGTWTEASLVSNLARKFADLVNMIKAKNYNGVYYNVYKSGAMEAMVKSLAELEAFQKKQGRRPIARGREIEMSDYLDEKKNTVMENSGITDAWFDTGSFKAFKRPTAREPFEIAQTDGELDHLEGAGKPQKYKKGYYIVTGPKGERYSMPPEEFHKLKKDNGDGTATPKPIVKLAKVADHSGVVKTSWGEDLNYNPEVDVIVRHGADDYGVVKKDIFDKTYQVKSTTDKN